LIVKKLALPIILILIALYYFAGSSNPPLIFPDPKTSEYSLPYPSGLKYELFQTYCENSGHRNRLAYDFEMPIGAEITASRSGVVTVVENSFSDEDHTTGHNNRVVIRHADESLAWYAHLKQGSIIVNPNDSVNVGQKIGECGNSGRTGSVPHLHFEVFREHLYNYSDAIPISFNNLMGKLDTSGMLVSGEWYQSK